MRPGQNRRMRGRSRSKGPNPLTRSYESNGPDVKIRGTAQHIADKYAQLSRDAQASGDPVAAENYLQHAEHYYRIIAAAQEQFRQQFGTTYQRPFDEDGEEGDEEGAGGNGYGYPQGNLQAGSDDGDPGMQPQPFEARGMNGERPQRFERNERYDRGERQDRDRFANRQDRSERQDRGSRPDRGERQDRGDRQDRGERQDRGGQDRGERPERFARGEQPRNGSQRSEGQQRPDSGQDDRREPEGANGLPAFLTTPVRQPISVDEANQNGGEPSPVEAADEANGRYGLRGRRRRRSRYGNGQAEEGAPDNGADFAPEGAEPPAE